MTQIYAICHLAMMPMRAEARHGSEMVSMLIFGESFEVLKSEGHWHYIRGVLDGYEGWVACRRLRKIDEKSFPKFLSRGGEVVEYSGCHSVLTPACPLPDGVLIQNPILVPSKPDLSQVKEYALLFLGAPYLWGGRSSLGIDCSGFTQLVLRLCGISLPRDAWQQAEVGVEVPSLDQVQEGDLVFFCETGTRVTHVGIILSGGEFIHASEYVRIDRIDVGGVFNRELSTYTLQPALIKRYV